MVYICSCWRRSLKNVLSMMTISDGNISRVTGLCAGIHRSPANSPQKCLYRGALMLSLICAWINGWANTRDAGDLRRHRAHHDVTVLTPLWPCVVIWGRASPFNNGSVSCFVPDGMKSLPDPMLTNNLLRVTCYTYFVAISPDIQWTLLPAELHL